MLVYTKIIVLFMLFFHLKNNEKLGKKKNGEPLNFVFQTQYNFI
jgi:hypothetical protein